MLWNPDRKQESGSKAKLTQTKWNDAAQVTGMEGPRGQEAVACLLPLFHPTPPSPHSCLLGGRVYLKGMSAAGTKTTKSRVFRFWGARQPGRRSLCNVPPNFYPCLSRAPRAGWKAWHVHPGGTDVVPRTPPLGAGSRHTELEVTQAEIWGHLSPADASCTRGTEISQTSLFPQGWERQKQFCLCFQILIFLESALRECLFFFFFFLFLSKITP